MKMPRDTQMSPLGPGQAPAPDVTLHAHGVTCGTLEPLLAQHLRALAPGQVLEIRSDRTEAAGAIRAWARLTGNALVNVETESTSGHARYLIRKRTPKT